MGYLPINGSDVFQKVALGEVRKWSETIVLVSSKPCVSALEATTAPVPTQERSVPHFVKTKTSHLDPHSLLLALSFFGESIDASSCVLNGVLLTPVVETQQRWQCGDCFVCNVLARQLTHFN